MNFLKKNFNFLFLNSLNDSFLVSLLFQKVRKLFHIFRKKSKSQKRVPLFSDGGFLDSILIHSENRQNSEKGRYRIDKRTNSHYEKC